MAAERAPGLADDRTGGAMGDFEKDTRVDGGEGRYRAALSQDWEIWGPNGGYLAAIALRAAGREARIPRPSSLTAHFLSVARFEPVDLAVAPVKSGRSAESLRVSMTQAGRPILEALIRTARQGPGLAHDVVAPPDVGDPETLPPKEDVWTGHQHPFWRNLDVHLTHAERALEPPQARHPERCDWYRFRPSAVFDDPFLDAGRALLLIDTLSWPAAAMPHPESGMRAPNLDVTAWFHRAAPKSEWLLAHCESPVAEDGLMSTTCRVYDQERRLLASGGTQLFCMPMPTG